MREVNLHDLSIDVLKQHGDWDEALEVEPELDRAEFTEMLQSIPNPQQHLAPAIRERLAVSTRDIVRLPPAARPPTWSASGGPPLESDHGPGCIHRPQSTVQPTEKARPRSR